MKELESEFNLQGEFMNQGNNYSEKDTTDTGRNLPNGDGRIGDEDIAAIDENESDGKPIGQDHSTEDHEKTAPTDGVGAVQNSSDTSSDIADIAE